MSTLPRMERKGRNQVDGELSARKASLASSNITPRHQSPAHSRSRHQGHHPFSRRRSPRSGQSSAAESPEAEALTEGGALVKTFDEATGLEKIVRQKIPSRDALIKDSYAEFKSQPQKIEQVSNYVKRQSLARQKQLAVEAIKRKHEDSYAQMLRKDVFNEQIARERSEVAYQLEVQDTLGHLGENTRELSMIRIHNFAVDALLHSEAEKLADQQIKQMKSKVLPENTTKVDILALTLESWRRRNIPEPIRRIVAGNASPFGGTSKARRQSIRQASSHFQSTLGGGGSGGSSPQLVQTARLTTTTGSSLTSQSLPPKSPRTVRSNFVLDDAFAVGVDSPQSPGSTERGSPNRVPSGRRMSTSALAATGSNRSRTPRTPLTPANGGGGRKR